MEYSKHLIEKKAAREKPPRRQQYTDIPQVARYAPRYVWEQDLHRDARGQSRRRGGRCEDGVVDLPDRGGCKGCGIESTKEERHDDPREDPIHLWTRKASVSRLMDV